MKCFGQNRKELQKRVLQGCRISTPSLADRSEWRTKNELIEWAAGSCRQPGSQDSVRRLAGLFETLIQLRDQLFVNREALEDETIGALERGPGQLSRRTGIMCVLSSRWNLQGDRAETDYHDPERRGELRAHPTKLTEDLQHQATKLMDSSPKSPWELKAIDARSILVQLCGADWGFYRHQWRDPWPSTAILCSSYFAEHAHEREVQAS